MDAALTVAGSGVAQAAAAEHDPDRSEAAVVAEFESDPAAVRLLVDAAESGRFDTSPSGCVTTRPRAERREAFTAGLRADGVTG